MLADVLADCDVNGRGLLGRVSLLCRHSPSTIPTIGLILFTQITIVFLLYSYCFMLFRESGIVRDSKIWFYIEDGVMLVSFPKNLIIHCFILLPGPVRSSRQINSAV